MAMGPRARAILSPGKPGPERHVKVPGLDPGGLSSR